MRSAWRQPASVDFGAFLWAVPSLALSVPGLLLVAAILAQAAGGLAWIPIARRKIGGFGLGKQHLGARDPAADLGATQTGVVLSFGAGRSPLFDPSPSG